MKKWITMKKILVYLMILSILLSNFIIKTPSVKAVESKNKPETFAKYNTGTDTFWNKQLEGVEIADRGSAWAFLYDTISYDNQKRAISYQTSNLINYTPWINLYFDKEYTTTGNDYWIAVLFQQEDDKGFVSTVMQSSSYNFYRYTAPESMAPWSYSNITYNGVEYKLAVAKISGWANNIVVPGITVFRRKSN